MSNDKCCSLTLRKLFTLPRLNMLSSENNIKYCLTCWIVRNAIKCHENSYKFNGFRRNTVCPTPYRTRHFFNNFTTNEVIAGGPLLRVATIRRTTDTHYRHIPLHFSHNERTSVQISLQYLHAGFGSEWDTLYNPTAGSNGTLWSVRPLNNAEPHIFHLYTAIFPCRVSITLKTKHMLPLCGG